MVAKISTNSSVNYGTIVEKTCDTGTSRLFGNLTIYPVLAGYSVNGAASASMKCSATCQYTENVAQCSRELRLKDAQV